MVQNKPQDALAEFQKEEEISPDDVRTIQAAAYAANLTGNKDLAIAETRKLLKADPGNVTSASALAGLLAQQSKYSDAAEVLEAAVKTVPDNANLHFQLGSIYLKNKQPEQAIAHLKAAVDQKDDDPMMLNNVAYTLAEAKTSLDLAQQYGEKAVDELDDQAEASESESYDAGMSVTYDYSLVWDTVGWIYFQLGDLKRAENFIQAAWLLGEDPTVGEHLGEIYEKEGKKQEAARSYEFALAVSPVPGFANKIPSLMSSTPPNVDRSLVDKIRTRYEKLTGKEPTAEIRRLPNGEWTQTPAEQLRHLREIKVGNQGKLSGSALFTLALKADKASVSFLSGDSELKPLSSKLSTAHYPFEFPGDRAAILVVRLDVNCRSTAPCVATLVAPVPPRPQTAGMGN
jgi:tetratricopeptide (TPR) repeat protein